MEIDDDEILSPTNTSPSSSDLDTESTGSFFPDRSTTLGTLMGVTLNTNTSRSIRPHASVTSPISTIPRTATPSNHRRRLRRRQRAQSGWWKLCRGDTVVPSKLGDFLEVRINNAGVLIEAEICNCDETVQREVGRLFENGRVLPPANSTVIDRRKKTAEVSSLVRLPVVITGICSGGER